MVLLLGINVLEGSVVREQIPLGGTGALPVHTYRGHRQMKRCSRMLKSRADSHSWSMRQAYSYPREFFGAASYSWATRRDGPNYALHSLCWSTARKCSRGLDGPF